MGNMQSIATPIESFVFQKIKQVFESQRRHLSEFKGTKIKKKNCLLQSVLKFYFLRAKGSKRLQSPRMGFRKLRITYIVVIETHVNVLATPSTRPFTFLTNMINILLQTLFYI